MKNKSGTNTIIIIVEVFILVGCNHFSGASDNTPLHTLTSGPTITLKSPPLITKQSSLATSTIQPTALQTSPHIILCDSVKKPLLNHEQGYSSEEFLSGVFQLCSLPEFSAFDFDEGEVVDKDDQESDLQLEVGKATFDNQIIYYLMEGKNSFVDEVGTSPLSYSECIALITSPTRLGYVVGTAPNVGCIKTNQGRIGFFQVTKVDPNGIESVEIAFVLWNKK